MPTFRQLANVFIRYANATFGGGSATTAVLHRAIVDELRWVAPERFAVIYALARLTPGTNLLALCTGLGWQLRGWRGALITLLPASIPCSLIVVAVAYFFDRWSHYRLAALAIRGAVAAAVGITVITCWTTSKPYLKSRHWIRAALMGATAFLLAAALQAVVVASAGLLLAAAIPLGQSALTSPVTLLIALATCGIMLTTKLDTLWIILGAAITTLTVSAVAPLLSI